TCKKQKNFQKFRIP
uniref:Uncharacterized protein n=1 Tax=Solanum lycopersicum TaxID=4081 RepID=A0A3Q7FM55_SOLLC